MKNFLKMTLATITGLILFSFVAIFISVAMIGAIAALGEKQPVMPSKAMLVIDMSTIMLSEQTTETDILTTLQSSGTPVSPLGIYSAINAINKAAIDPAIRFIYIKPDGSLSGVAHLEELRTALENFRKSGKAVVSYMENPTNGGYYLASVSDKIYMTPYDGGINMFTGLSSQLIFLKDILDRLGVNIQLIRHGKYKSAGEMFIRSSSSKENLEQNEAMVKSIWNSWSSVIAQSREISPDKLNALLDNLSLNSAQDFIDNGLVDEALSREELGEKLATFYLADSADDLKYIPFTDYVATKKTTINLSDKKVAVIFADGNIVDGKEKQQVAGDHFASVIAKIRKDPAVKAVVLRVNSPGGSVLASEKIKAELDLLRENVPVIASYGAYAASGGYWISANSDYIFSNATTLTGSIGVFSMIPDFGKAIKNNLHVTITKVNSNKHSDMYSLMRPLDKAEVAYMQASVETIYDKFTSLVAEGRDMSVVAVDNIAQGRVWTGAEALEIGLVDQIGTLEDAINYAAQSIEGVTSYSEVNVECYPKPLTTIELILESINGPTEVFAGTPLESVEEAFRDWNQTQSGKAYARLPYEITIQ